MLRDSLPVKKVSEDVGHGKAPDSELLGQYFGEEFGLLGDEPDVDEIESKIVHSFDNI